MKKIVFTLVAATLCYGCLTAQNEAVRIDSKAIKINKPLQADSFSFKLQYCGLNITSGKRDIGGTIPWNGQSNENAVETLSSGQTQWGLFGYIYPEIDNVMDVGNATHFFKKGYINQPVTKTNQATLSDGRYKENIKDLKDATDKIMALRAVSFDLKKTEGDVDTAELKNKVGFIAQEMQDVLPYSVGYIPEIDMYTVDYTSVIPYLVQAFQSERSEKEEMRLQMTELQNQVSSLQELVQSLLAQNGTTPPAPNNAPKHGPKNTVKAARLFQNLPNPFSESTIIRYELPKAAGNAYIQVFDMGGRMVENIQLSHTQEIG